MKSIIVQILPHTVDSVSQYDTNSRILKEELTKDILFSLWIVLQISNQMATIILHIKIPKTIMGESGSKDFIISKIQSILANYSNRILNVFEINEIIVYNLSESVVNCKKIDENLYDLLIEEKQYDSLLADILEYDKTIHTFSNVICKLKEYNSDLPIFIKSNFSVIRKHLNFIFDCIRCSGDYNMRSWYDEKFGILENNLCAMSNRSNIDHYNYKSMYKRNKDILFSLQIPKVWISKPPTSLLD